MNLLFKGLFGSHLYGLNNENSDRDYKGVYLPNMRDVILGKVKRNINETTGGNDSKNTSDDIDTEIFSLHEFIKLACQGQTVAIDMLHTPISLTENASFIWGELVANRTKFYSKNMNAFMGYVKKQAAKYGIKGSKIAVLEQILEIIDKEVDDYDTDEVELSRIIHLLPIGEYTSIHINRVPVRINPNDHRFRDERFYVINGSMMHDVITLKEFRIRVQKQLDNYGERAKLARDNDGVDWKAVSHALRAGYQLRDIFIDGDFEYPLKETQFLLDVKEGKLDYITVVASELESLVDELETLSKNSNLPEEVDIEYWEDFIYTIYMNLLEDI